MPAEVDRALAQGRTLVCNLSRAAVEDARRRWPQVLGRRLSRRAPRRWPPASPRAAAKPRRTAARGSNAPAEIAPDAVIENDGELADAADRLYALLQARRKALA